MAGEDVILERATEALRALGLTVTAQKAQARVHQAGADAYLRVSKDQHGVDYVADVKRTVTPATLGATVMQLRKFAADAKRTPLLVATHVTPPVGQQLRALGQPFADTAGNAYLEGPGFLVFITGLKPKGGEPALPRPGRAYTPAGLKVVFALICDPELAAAPHRAIAAAAGVALGAVPPVLADMRQQGHLLVADEKRRLNATRRLLDEWAMAYARTLRPKTLRATYVTANFDTWPKWRLEPQARWGGEPAANLLVRHLKPGELTIYTNKLPARLMVEQRLTPAGLLGAEHLLEVREPFWGDTLRNDGRPDTVPPALVYADLLATGDARCIETARMIYDGYLARLFPEG